MSPIIQFCSNNWWCKPQVAMIILNKFFLSCFGWNVFEISGKLADLSHSEKNAVKQRKAEKKWIWLHLQRSLHRSVNCRELCALSFFKEPLVFALSMCALDCAAQKDFDGGNESMVRTEGIEICKIVAQFCRSTEIAIFVNNSTKKVVNWKYVKQIAPKQRRLWSKGATNSNAIAHPADRS